MATFRVERWKHWESSDPSEFYLVPPEIHPYAWQVPRWWYKGNNTIYETCVQVQGPNYIMYIDGLTPAMEFEFTVNGTDFDITDWRDVRRIAITPSYEELLKEDGQYVDMELTLQNEWVVRHNTLPDPIIDIPPTWIENPYWVLDDVPEGANAEVTIGKPVKVVCGDYIGGMPPLTFRGRWQVQDQADAIFSGPWQTITPNEEVVIADLESEEWWPEDYKALRFMNQIRDTDPTTDSFRTTNKFVSWAPINTPDPLVITQTASWVNTNVYEPGEKAEAKTAVFTGGSQPVTCKYRFQRKTGDSWESYTAWVSVPNEQTSVYLEITEYGDYRMQSRATDDEGVAVTSTTGAKTVEACTPLPNLPDLDSGGTSSNMCYADGPYGYADVQGLPLLPS